MVLIDSHQRDRHLFYLFKPAIRASPFHINICTSHIYCLTKLILKSTVLFSVQWEIISNRIEKIEILLYYPKYLNQYAVQQLGFLLS